MKNAYLIIAHGNYHQLQRLLKQLDDENNDMYIHINSLVSMPNVDEIYSSVKKSKIVFSDRIPVVWGEYGILEAMLVALRCAKSNGKYDYYHVLTGADIPLKTNKEIETFLVDNLYNNESNNKLRTNYIYIDDTITHKTKARVIHYNLLVKYWRNPNPFIRKGAKGINEIGYYIQKLLRVDRVKKLNLSIKKGAPWWSISDEFAEFVLENEEWCEAYFKDRTFGADETAIQTLIYNSEFKDSLFRPDKSILNGNIRLIDWKRGYPYTWQNNDFDELINYQHLYARKFDEKFDNEIIDKLYSFLEERSKNEI